MPTLFYGLKKYNIQNKDQIEIGDSDLYPFFYRRIFSISKIVMYSYLRYKWCMYSVCPSLNTQSCNRRPFSSTFTFENVRSLELVSKELNHLAAILHVYAGGLNFMK